MPTFSSNLRSIFWIALAVRIAHVLCLQAAPFGDYLVGDAARYDAWAREIARGNWLGNEVFYQAPLYPYLLGLVYATLGDSLLLIRLLQALLGAGTCGLVAATGQRLFGERAGWWAGLSMAVYAPAIFLEGLLQKSALDLFFVALSMWLLSRLLVQDRARGWFALGTTTAALALTRENALLAIPLLMLWMVWRPGLATGWRAITAERTRRLVGFAGGLAALLIPVAARNAYVGGEWHLTTSQVGPNFYIGNHPTASGTYAPLATGRGDARYEAVDARQIAEAAVGRELTAGEVSKYYLDRSWQFMREQPVAWLALLAKKTALALNRFELVDTEDQYTVAGWSPVLRVCDVVGNFGWLLPLAVIGIWLSRHDWRRLWWAYALIAVMLGTMVVFFVFGRYRLPVAPLLALFAGCAIEQAGQVITAGRGSWRAAIRTWCPAALRQPLLTGTILLLLVVGRWPLVDRGEARAVTLANYGAIALTRGEFAEAEKFLMQAVELQPRFVEAQNNLGVLYRFRGEPRLAEVCFRRALEIAPDYTNARTNLDAVAKDERLPISRQPPEKSAAARPGAR